MAKLCSAKTRKLISDAAKKRWADPVFKELASKKIREAKAGGYTEETKERMACSARCRFQDPQQKQAASGRMKDKWQDPEYRKHQSDIHKGLLAGEKHPMFGKHHTEEACRKIRENRSTSQPPPMLGKTHSEASRSKMSKSHKGVHLSEKHRASIGEASKRVWAGTSEEKKNQWQGKIRKSLQCFPNKPETAVLSILDSLYPGEWKFVGDGQVIISGKNPDFINVNGQKKIIELFGDYWHRGKKAEDRAAIFSPFGYQTLVIWERELKNPDLLINQIRVFAEAA